MATRSAMLVLLLLLYACHEEVRFLPLPPGDGAIALLMESTEQVGLWILARDRAGPLRLEPEDAEETVISAVVFEPPEPSALGLPEGAVTLEAEGPLTRRLLVGKASARFYRAGPEAGWEEQAAPNPRFDTVWVRDPSLCPNLEVETVTVQREEVSSGFSFGASLDSNTVLLAHADGQVYRVDAEHRVSEVEFNGLDARVSVMAVQGEELWVGTSSGSIYRAPRTGPYEFEAFSSPTELAIDRLVFSRVGDHSDIFLMDREPSVWRHDGQGWILLHRYSIVPTLPHNKDLIEVEPGHVLAASLGEPVLVRFRAGELSLEEPSESPISGFNRLVHLPGFASIASGTFGELYSDNTGEWAPLMHSSLNVNVGVMARFRGGVLLGHISTGVELIYPERGHVCGAKELTANLRAEVLRPIGGEILLGGPERNPGPNASVVFLSTIENDSTLSH